MPHAGIDDVGALRIHRDIACTARCTQIERFVPGTAAVERNVYAAIRRIVERIAESTDDDVARILRIDRDARDAPNALQTDAPPRLRTVRRQIEAVAVAHVVA